MPAIASPAVKSVVATGRSMKTREKFMARYLALSGAEPQRARSFRIKRSK